MYSVFHMPLRKTHIEKKSDPSEKKCNISRANSLVAVSLLHHKEDIPQQVGICLPKPFYMPITGCFSSENAEHFSEQENLIPLKRIQGGELLNLILICQDHHPQLCTK